MDRGDYLIPRSRSSALALLAARGLVSDVLAQIGMIMLVGLAGMRIVERPGDGDQNS